MRFSHVDWKILDKNSHPEEEAQYLIAADVEGEAVYTIAQWRTKGTKIELEKLPEALLSKEEKEALPLEKKLMIAIFGDRQEVTIPEDGFYTVTKDYGTDSKNYPGCAEIPVCHGSYRNAGKVYWAELPLEPKGLIHPYEAEKQERIKHEEEIKEMHRVKEEHEKQEAKALEEAVAKGGLIDSMGGAQWPWRDTWKPAACTDVKGNKLEGVFELPGIIIEADVNWRNKVYAAACQAVETYNDIMKQISEDDIVNAISNARAGKTDDLMKIHNLIWETTKKHDKIGIRNEKHMRYTRLIKATVMDTPYFQNGTRGFDAWAKRLSKDSWFKQLLLEEKIAVNDSFAKASYRLGRCATLIAMGLPEVIRANELRMLFEKFTYLFGNIKGYTKSFGKTFGYTMDGKCCRRYVECGEIFEEAEDDNLPPLPENLPEYDELGEPIPYAYNKHTGEWSDARTSKAIERTKELTEKIQSVTTRLTRAAKYLEDQIFRNIGELVATLAQYTNKEIYYEICKKNEGQQVLKLSVDMGLFDIVTFAVVTFAVANLIDYNYKGICYVIGCISFSPENIKAAGIEIDDCAGNNVVKKTDAIQYIIKPN